MYSLKRSTIIKILLTFELIFIILSPKGFKGLTGYEGTYPNFQFLYMMLLLPFLLYHKILNFDTFQRYHSLFFLLYIQIILYFFSSIITILSTSIIKPSYLLSESARQSLNYILIFMPFLFIKKNYLIFALKTLIVLGLFEIFFVVYGILGTFNILPISTALKEIAENQIFAQSWTSIGFIPKWGGTFDETQILSTFFLICFIISDLLEKLTGKEKNIRISKILFSISIIYCFSKSTIPAFLFYLLFKNLKSNNLSRYILFTPFIILIIFFFPLLVSKEEISQIGEYQNLSELGQSYSSIGERLFHINNIFAFMSQDIVKCLFGLGPRAYGTLVSLKYPGSFNPNTNSISAFTVFSDIGFIGFGVFLFFLFVIYKKFKTKTLKIAYLSILIACLPQISWGIGVIILIIALLLNYDTIQFEQ